jgi:hypothetical protein
MVCFIKPVLPRRDESAVDVRLWDVRLLAEDEGRVAEAWLLQVPVNKKIDLVRREGHLRDSVS